MYMRTASFSRYLQFCVVALLLGFAGRVCAAPKDDIAQAYRLLKHADADYHGHRVIALKEVQAAGKQLGLNLQGDLPTEEKQAKSDQQLKHARNLLADAQVKLEEKDRTRVANHLTVAISEIDAALKVK
jgi:hypothetical protein